MRDRGEPRSSEALSWAKSRNERKNWGGGKRPMHNRQKLREKEDVKVLDDDEVKFTDL